MQEERNVFLGFDIGGTGIKAALVDIDQGKLITEKMRELTPKPADPKSVAKVVKKMFDRFDYQGPVGCGFPAIIHNGVAESAANIDKSWIEVNIQDLFSEACGVPFHAANDADVAGLAEVKFGHGNEVDGTIIVLTIGTGIGSGFFLDGKLVPNTELGHLFYKKSVYEHYVSNSARKSEELSWKEWAFRFSGYLTHLEKLFSPDLFILGGGASKKFDKYEDQLDVRTRIVPAEYQNDAGVLGAAMYANERTK
ncbi:MAG: ROK family protein [Saprospiraceae bacterium]|nr:ROK family protein [Saprospiraceae bacterium]